MILQKALQWNSYPSIEIGWRQMKMFQKAQEVLYNFNVQPKAHLLEFLSENPIIEGCCYPDVVQPDL